MDINIGISEVDRARSADAVAKLLADTYTLYLKTHGYHWNAKRAKVRLQHFDLEQCKYLRSRSSTMQKV